MVLSSTSSSLALALAAFLAFPLLRFRDTFLIPLLQLDEKMTGVSVVESASYFLIFSRVHTLKQQDRSQISLAKAQVLSGSRWVLSELLCCIFPQRW